MKHISKKALLIGSRDAEDVKFFLQEFKKYSYDIVYILATFKMDALGVPVHGLREAARGIPHDEIDTQDFPPPSAELIRDMYKTESLILTMMNRFVGDISTDEKKHIYFILLQYWSGVLDKYKPDALFLTMHPHNPAALVLYMLARKRGIPTPFINETWISDRLVVQDDYENGCPSLRRALERNCKKQWTLDDITSDLRDFYIRQADIDANPLPLDLKILAKTHFDLWSLWKKRGSIVLNSIKDASIFARVTKFIKRYAGDNLKREHYRVESQVDLTVPYIYVPLQLQPEGSTSPLGDMFADQILIIEMLSFVLPNGWRIYVKDNPYQWKIGGAGEFTNMRYRGFYKKIASLRGAYLVPIDTNPYVLTKHAKIVATTTSRSVFDAVFAGKFAFVFGFPWFTDMPGVIRVDSVGSLQKALKLAQYKEPPSKDDVLAFFKSLDEVSVHGTLGQFGKNNTSVSAEDSVKGAVKILVSGLENRT
jgi:hypothetical protein